MINFPTHISCTVRIVHGSGTAVESDLEAGENVARRRILVLR